MKNFNLLNSNGEKLNLIEFQGESYLLLIFFRGAWCNHCKKQLQSINKLFDSYQEKNIKLLGISNDNRLKSSLLKTFLKINFPILSDEDNKLIKHFDLLTEYNDQQVAKPSVILFNSKHEKIYEYIGQDYDDRLTGQQILKDCIKSITYETKTV
jgi:peroxiredoxin